MSEEEQWIAKEENCPKCNAPCEIYYQGEKRKMECLECGHQEGDIHD
ncbi:MAG: hypothetical protein OEZ36_09415 [Spirochaetota bacterium]|nr:hypothetical protein [Spirochaetota bacterium]